MSRYDKIKYYNGNTWVTPNSVKVYNGTEWLDCGDTDSTNTNNFKIYNGEKWANALMTKTTLTHKDVVKYTTFSTTSDSTKTISSVRIQGKLYISSNGTYDCFYSWGSGIYVARVRNLYSPMLPATVSGSSPWNYIYPGMTNVNAAYVGAIVAFPQTINGYIRQDNNFESIIKTPVSNTHALFMHFTGSLHKFFITTTGEFVYHKPHTGKPSLVSLGTGIAIDTWLNFDLTISASTIVGNIGNCSINAVNPAGVVPTGIGTGPYVDTDHTGGYKLRGILTIITTYSDNTSETFTNNLDYRGTGEWTEETWV